MENVISQSIVMRVREFGETDLLVSFFSRDMGRLKGVAKGARRSTKRFPNCLDLFSLVSMEFRCGRRGDLYFLDSCRLIHGFPGLRSEYARIFLASYLFELTEVLFPLGVTDKDMFDLLIKSLYVIERGQENYPIRSFFEARAMALGGFEIALDRCCHCGRKYSGEGRAVFSARGGGIACQKCLDESQLSPGLAPESVAFLRKMQNERLDQNEAIQLSQECIGEIETTLKLHLKYRLGRELKTSF